MGLSEKRAAALELAEQIHGDLAGLEDIPALRRAIGDWCEALGPMKTPADLEALDTLAQALEGVRDAYLGLPVYEAGP